MNSRIKLFVKSSSSFFFTQTPMLERRNYYRIDQNHLLSVSSECASYVKTRINRLRPIVVKKSQFPRFFFNVFRRHCFNFVRWNPQITSKSTRVCFDIKDILHNMQKNQVSSRSNQYFMSNGPIQVRSLCSLFFKWELNNVPMSWRTNLVGNVPKWYSCEPLVPANQFAIKISSNGPIVAEKPLLHCCTTH